MHLEKCFIFCFTFCVFENLKIRLEVKHLETIFITKYFI